MKPMPFSRDRAKSSSSAASRTVLNSKLLSGSPCFVPVLISNISLSLSVKSVAFFVASFDVFGSDSVTVSCISIFQSVNSNLQLFNRELKNFFRLFNTSTNHLHRFQSHFCVLPALLHHIGRQLTVCYRIHRRQWQFLFLDVITSPFVIFSSLI